MTHKELLSICRKFLGKNYYYPKVTKQIDEYVQNIGLTYEQIAEILKYWYIVKKSNPEKSGGGIGIVPHIYQEALEYWEKETVYQTNIAQIESYLEPETEHITAPSPYITKPKTLKIFELQ